MDFLTHLVFGALLYNFIFKALPFQYIHYAVFFAILPDLDVFIAPLKRIFKSNYLEHRSGSHSYVIGILISAILSGLFSIFTRQPFYVLWLIGVFFYGLHVSLDLLTTTKIPCFFPLSRKEYCFYVEKAGSSFTLFISLFFIIILSLFFLYVPKFALILVIIDFFTYFFFFYYSFRIAQKFWVNANLNENQKYFPGVLPFYYFIFEKELTDNELFIRIQKRSLLFETKVMYENTLSLSPQEMEFFKKGQEICMKNYYYAKWTILPVFFRKKETLIIRFFFVEPMLHSRAMYFQFEFNLITKELISNNQSYGHL